MGDSTHHAAAPSPPLLMRKQGKNGGEWVGVRGREGRGGWLVGKGREKMGLVRLSYG